MSNEAWYLFKLLRSPKLSGKRRKYLLKKLAEHTKGGDGK